MRVQKILPLFFISLALTACGGSSGGGGSKSSSSKAVTSSSTAVSSSAATSSNVSVSSNSSISSSVDSGSNPTPSSSSSSESSLTQSSSSSSSSSESSLTQSSSSSSSIAVIIIDMTDGWRGNSSGNTANSGITYNADGIIFTAAGAGVGAVFDVLKPTQLEGAVVEMVVNASSEFKASGANLQIFAQLKNDWGKGEWNCTNNELTADTDTTLTCTIDESDRKFNQSTNDVQMGLQATGTPAGTVTIKSAKITLAPPGSISSASSSSYSSYDASVVSLKALADFPIGVSVSNTDAQSVNILTNDKEKALVLKHFNQMTAGNIMKMSYMHPTNNGTEADYNFTDADAFVSFAKDNNIGVHSHVLIWHSGYQVPQFMKNWQGTSEAFLAMLDNHVTTLVNHFKTFGNIDSWDVVNEALTDDEVADYRKDDPNNGSTFYVKSGNSPIFIERAFIAADKADPNVDLYYNDYNIENNGSKTNKMIEMVTDFKARSIPIDGVGFQMHVCLGWPSINDIYTSMKQVADLGLKVKITELDVAVNQPYCNNYPANKVTVFTPAIAFEQKKRYCDIVAAYKTAVPPLQRGGITVWGTTDGSTWLDGTYTIDFEGEKISWPLLFDDQYGDKPALRGFADALSGTACTNL